VLTGKEVDYAYNQGLYAQQQLCNTAIADPYYLAEKK